MLLTKIPENKYPTEMKIRAIFILTATSAIGLSIGDQADAAAIVYDFTGGTPSATTNDFAGAGVVAGDFETEVTGNRGAGPSADFDRLQRNLRDQDLATFTVSF